MPKLLNQNTLQITLLCLGFLGIQIGFALQAGNLTRIFQNLGADLTEVSFIWIIAPLAGAIVQPFIGYWSDRKIYNGKSRLPYLLVGGICCTICLLLLPNTELLASLATPLVLSIWIMLLIDVSFNISMHPLRAVITDYLPFDQQPKGFALQTCLISIGAILGSTLPYFTHHLFGLNDVSSTNQLPNNVKWSFYIGAIILLLCISITALKISKSNIFPSKEIGKAENKKITINRKMWFLGAIQFFSWAAFFLIWIYMTPAISQYHYNEFNYSTQSKDYAKAANFTGILFGIYHFSACIFALILPFLYKRISIIITHSIALAIGGLSLIGIYGTSTVSELYLPMVGLGFAWASILASPFSLLSKIIPQRSIGLYFGIFNLFITIPQIVIGISSGYMINGFFDGEVIYAIVMAGVCLLLSATLSVTTRKLYR